MFPLAVRDVNVPAAGVTLPIMPCTEVAVATPKTGVTRVGLVANTNEPEPVSSVTAVLRLADDGVAKKVATPDPKPLIPVATGNPVALVRVAADGVPKFGVVSAGLVANTNAPLPVSSDTALAKLADEGVAKNVATLVPKPLMPVETGNPVQLVNVPELGVPRTGVTNVGLVANTSAPDPVSSVTAVFRLADDGVAKNVPTPVPNPLIPVPTGSPVQFVSVPEVGVPKIGVVKLGDVADKVTPLIVPPVMVAPEDTSVFSVAVLEADKVVNAPVLAVDAPIGVLLIEPPVITGLVRVFPDNATPVIEPPVITGAVMV